MKVLNALIKLFVWQWMQAARHRCPTWNIKVLNSRACVRVPADSHRPQRLRPWRYRYLAHHTTSSYNTHVRTRTHAHILHSNILFHEPYTLLFSFRCLWYPHWLRTFCSWPSFFSHHRVADGLRVLRVTCSLVISSALSVWFKCGSAALRMFGTLIFLHNKFTHGVNHKSYVPHILLHSHIKTQTLHACHLVIKHHFQRVKSLSHERDTKGE